MPGKMSDLGSMAEKIIKSEGDAREDEESGHALEKGLGKHWKRLDLSEYRKR